MTNPVDDLSTGEVTSDIVQTFNGAISYFGTTRRTPRSQKIIFRGMYVAQKGVLADQSGRVLTQVTGGVHKHFLSTGQFFTDLKVKTDLLKGRLGYLDRLVRQPEDTVGKKGAERKLQWKLARLLSVTHMKELKNTNRVAEIEATFETTMSAWKSVEPTSYSGTIKNRDGNVQITTLGSQSVNDFTLKLWPVGGGLTKVTISMNGTTLVWDSAAQSQTDTSPAFPAAQAVPSGVQITMDMGRETIQIDGRNNAYNYLKITPRLPGWLYLAPGSNIMNIRTAGADVSYQVDFFNQWT